MENKLIFQKDLFLGRLAREKKLHLLKDEYFKIIDKMDGKEVFKSKMYEALFNINMYYVQVEKEENTIRCSVILDDCILCSYKKII